MPSYIYRRQLAPSQTRETLDQVRARLIEELRIRTEERVNHWNQLGDWCRQRPGRYIGIDWRPASVAVQLVKPPLKLPVQELKTA